MLHSALILGLSMAQATILGLSIVQATVEPVNAQEDITITPIIELLEPPTSVNIKGNVILRRFNTSVIQDNTGAVYVRCPPPIGGNINPQVGDVIIATGHYNDDTFVADNCRLVE